MTLKSGVIIPFIYKDTKKLIAIPSQPGNIEVNVSDIKQAVYSAFTNLKDISKFYNFKIGFQIPEEILVPYLEQRHDLTNFIIEIIESEKDKNDEIDDQENQVTIHHKSKEKTNKREATEDSQTQLKKVKLEDVIDKYLENLLKTSTKGKEICSNFKSANQLSDEDRDALVDLVIDSEITNILELKKCFAIDSKRLITLTAAIVRKFPGENTSIYFNDKNLKSLKMIAGGKLYEKFLKKKTQYILQQPQNDKYIASEKAIQADFPEIQELENYTNDWELYLRAWQCTFDLRIVYLRKTFDYLGYFENLISSVYERASDLVEYDFNRLYLNKSNNLFKNWDFMSEKIFTEALLMNQSDVPLILDLYGNFSELSGLMVLNYFVENFDSDIKPFIKDDPQNLVIHIDKTIGNPEEFFKNSNETYDVLTPFIFAIGELDNEINFYVLFGTKLLKMESVLKAVDFAFKLYQILQLSCTIDLSLSWQIIRTEFYGINADKPCAASEKILKVLRNI